MARDLFLTNSDDLGSLSSASVSELQFLTGAVGGIAYENYLKDDAVDYWANHPSVKVNVEDPTIEAPVAGTDGSTQTYRHAANLGAVSTTSP